MKLRSSLAVSAVTALTSSAALFAAPAAFAAETPAPTSPSPSVTATATPAATATASATTTSASGSDEGADKSADKSQDQADTSDKATGTPSGAPTAPSADKSAAQTAGSGPAEQIPNPEKGNGPSIAFSGLPGDVVVGGKPVDVAVDIKNTTGTKMEFLPFVSLGNVASDKPLKASHIILEAKLPGSDAWTKVELVDTALDDGGASAAIGWFAGQDPKHPGEPVPLVLDKNQALRIQLRLAFTADAPLGETFAFLLGLGSGNLEDVEYESASDFYIFNLVAAGTPGPANPEVRPVPPVKLPPKPKPAQPGQNLAATGGSDSSATTYAIIGGVALVGGAGLLVVMKRRKGNGATPA